MECIKFFRRKPLDFNSRGVEFEPAKGQNIDEFLFTPVVAGIWQQHELWDGTYTYDDLLDAHELLSVKYENECRANDAGRKDN